MKPCSVLAVLVLALFVFPAFAELDSDDRKLVDRYTKIIEKNKDPGERRSAARSLGMIKEPEVVAPLTVALSERDPAVLVPGFRILGSLVSLALRSTCLGDHARSDELHFLKPGTETAFSFCRDLIHLWRITQWPSLCKARRDSL